MGPPDLNAVKILRAQAGAGGTRGKDSKDFAGILHSSAGSKIRAEKFLTATAGRNVLGLILVAVCYFINMELQVGVKVLLKNFDGKYLVMRRSPIKYPESQKWDIPGGRIDPGATLMENLAREVREETGLSISGTPRLIAAQDILKIAGRHVVRLTYVGNSDGGTPVLSEEHTEYQWVTLDELKNVDPLDSYCKALVDAGLIS